MGSCLLTSHHNQLINFKTAFTMSMEKPSFAWPLFACLLCCPIGIATCCQYSAIGTAIAAGNQDVVDNEVKKMKYSAKWAIGIGLALTIFIVVWIMGFKNDAEDAIESLFGDLAAALDL